MIKYVFRKSLVIGLIILFLGASVIPNVLGNNYSSIDYISEAYIQKNPSNGIDYLVLWAGDAYVRWNWSWNPFESYVDVTCPPDNEFTYNLSEPSTLYIIVILNTTLDLRNNFVIKSYYEK